MKIHRNIKYLIDRFNQRQLIGAFFFFSYCYYIKESVSHKIGFTILECTNFIIRYTLVL